MTFRTVIINRVLEYGELVLGTFLLQHRNNKLHLRSSGCGGSIWWNIVALDCDLACNGVALDCDSDCDGAAVSSVSDPVPGIVDCLPCRRPCHNSEENDTKRFKTVLL